MPGQTHLGDKGTKQCDNKRILSKCHDIAFCKHLIDLKENNKNDLKSRRKVFELKKTSITPCQFLSTNTRFLANFFQIS